MPNIKKILDISDPAEEPFALNLIHKISAENPTQEIGSKGLIIVTVRDKKFAVIRNKDSYTVREEKINERQNP